MALHAQEYAGAEKRGNKSFETLNYQKAIKKYNKTSSLSLDSKRKLAESYRLSNNTIESEKVYAELTNEASATPEDLYYYAFVLKENKKYSESNDWMQKYQDKVKNLRTEHFSEDKGKLSKFLTDEGYFSVQNININTAQEDFGTSYYKEKVVFASSREGAKMIKRRWNGNQMAFLDLYESEGKDNQLTNLSRFGNNTNNKYHEGPASFSNAGAFMAYTANNYTGKSTDGTIKLKIFFSKNQDNKWSKGEGFFLNNDQYSVGHPCLSEDGNTMYFASDMPGGLGGVDLYKVTRANGAEWSQPVNLGKEVNTDGNEMFPFFHEQSQMLYFASDGQFGLGGLDVFVSPLNGATYKQVSNLGAPINTEKDDFALIVDKGSKAGFLSSNRLEGKGDDDIYSFNMLKPLLFGKRLMGVSKDKKGMILSETKVYLYDNKGIVIDSTVTNDKGAYEFIVEADKDFVLKGARGEYFESKSKVTSRTKEDVIVADLELMKDPKLSWYLVVTDKKTKEPIPQVQVTLTDLKTNKVSSFNTTADGDYLYALVENKLNDKLNFRFKLEAPGYLSKTVDYTQLLDKEGRYDVHKTLDVSLNKIKVGETRLEDIIVINPIYFDLNKFFIRPDAAKELDKIVKAMNENPTLVVELGSHTDCRASLAYNVSLSDKRAKASAKYIAEKITDPSRIYGKGYGETILLNGCACEGTVKSTCTEEEHQKNRRTEFKVVKFDAPNTKVINNSTDSFKR